MKEETSSQARRAAFRRRSIIVTVLGLAAAGTIMVLGSLGLYPRACLIASSLLSLFTLSNGVQKGPPIGVEEGPLFGYDVGLLKMALRCVRRRAGVARPEARAAQDRFLKAPKVAVSCGF